MGDMKKPMLGSSLRTIKKGLNIGLQSLTYKVSARRGAAPVTYLVNYRGYIAQSGLRDKPPQSGLLLNCERARRSVFNMLGGLPMFFSSRRNPLTLNDKPKILFIICTQNPGLWMHINVIFLRYLVYVTFYAH